MKKLLCLVLLLAASTAVQAQSTCAATDMNRFAAVLAGDAFGHGSFHIDEERGLLTYHIDASNLSNASGARLVRAGADVLDLIVNDQSFESGVLEGTVAPPAGVLDALLSNPSAYSLEVTAGARAMRGRLNGRGGVLMVGPLDMPSSASAKIKSDVASNATGIFTLEFVDDDPNADDVRVDFDLMTDSVDGFDTASVVLVGDGLSEDILDLVSMQGFTGGRLHGEARISRDELARVVADPSRYHVEFRSPNDGLFSGAMAEAVTTFIPAFGRARNANGNQFSSDLRLYNPGSTAQNVFVQFFPAGATDSLAAHSAIIRLEPGQSRTIDDAVPALFGNMSTMGALRVVAGKQVVADSEIGNGNAAMGQFIPGLASCSAVTNGVLTSLNASQSANGFRTNVLIGNPGAHSAVAHFELRNDQGRVLDSRLMTIPAHAQMLMPLGNLFRGAASDLRNVVLTMHADTPLFLGSSLVQNGTGEARFHSARDLGQ